MEQHQRDRLTGLGLLAVGLLLILGAFPVGVSAVRRYWAEQEPLDWPTVEGESLSVSVLVLESYYPQVEYSYAVEGRRYRGNQLAIHPLSFADPEEANRLAIHYDLGTRHPVYYDPADPGRSLLIIGTSRKTRLLLGLPFVMAGGGALLLWGCVVYRRPPKRRKISEFDI